VYFGNDAISAWILRMSFSVVVLYCVNSELKSMNFVSDGEFDWLRLYSSNRALSSAVTFEFKISRTSLG
jgi:hypothetical protein